MSISKSADGNGRKATATEASANRPPESPPTALRPVGTDAVAPGLIGARLRARRMARGISLRQFARDLDVSASFISQLETGKAQPSVATLFAICAALDIATDDLFENYAIDGGRGANGSSGEGTDAANNSWRTNSSFGDLPTTALVRDNLVGTVASSPVVHPGQRKVLVLDSGVTWESLTAIRSEKADFMLVRYDVGGSSTMEGRLIRHVGTEYGFVLSGMLEITVGFETYRLSAGDSITFDSSRPHRLANVSDVPVEAIWFNLEQFGTSH